jgi:tungstate transport system ATP-binding protein
MNKIYKLQKIEFAYGENIALCVDEYSIEKNVVTALVGANGSGKSTLLNLLAFIITPTKGELYFADEKVNSEKENSLRRRIAYVQQRPYLFNFSVIQNIELGLKLREVDKNVWAKRTGDAAEKLNLSSLLHKRAHDLSGGEIQKVAIARALVLEPEVLILDEPFTHLDKEAKRDIETLIEDVAEDGAQTVIFSSHDQLQAQKLAHQVCALDKGQIKSCLLLNTFRGQLDMTNSIFRTDKSMIQVPSTIKSGTQIAVDPAHLVLSKDELKSSMRNHFQGKIKALREEEGEIHVVVEAGESWQAIITKAALSELNINIGEQVWISFKSSSVQIF